MIYGVEMLIKNFDNKMFLYFFLLNIFMINIFMGCSSDDTVKPITEDKSSI
jgi:hypothetical protein